ncbi:MAG: hypothetical protein ACRCU2_06230 [Planktothrix sp.]
MNKQLFNLSQNLLEIVGLPPRDCECKTCESGMIFECYRCHKLVPWCQGATDDYLDWCNACVGEYMRIEGFPTD